MIYARYTHTRTGERQTREFESVRAYSEECQARAPFEWISHLLGHKLLAVLGEDGAETVFFKRHLGFWWIYDHDGSDLANGELDEGEIMIMRLTPGVDEARVHEFVDQAVDLLIREYAA